MHKTLIGLSFVALLAGCSGNTYGTGVSSERQLLNDLTDMVSIGPGAKKEKINYTARPTLVKPPEVASLPAPAEKVEAESAYFPEDPEEKRKRLIASLGEDGVAANGQLAPEIEALRAESRARNTGKDRYPKKYANLPRNQDGDCDLCEFYMRMEADKIRLEQKTAERQRVGVQKRRYLTEPPDEYRKPAETAVAGVLGEEETSDNGIKKKKKPILDTVLGQ